MAKELTLSLDSLIGDGTQDTGILLKKKEVEIAGPPVRAKFDPEPKPVRAPFPEARVLLWSKFFCRCGHSYEAPDFAGTSLFVRVRIQKWGTQLHPIHQGMDHWEGTKLSTLPLERQISKHHINVCPNCVDSHNEEKTYFTVVEPISRTLTYHERDKEDSITPITKLSQELNFVGPPTYTQWSKSQPQKEEEDPTPYCHVCGAMDSHSCGCPKPFYALRKIQPLDDTEKEEPFDRIIGKKLKVTVKNNRIVEVEDDVTTNGN